MNQSIKITSDSTCDLPEAKRRQYGIDVIPLHVEMGNQSYLDGVDIDPERIYDSVKSGGGIPGTAAPNIAEFQDMFSRLSNAYDKVLHVSMSGELSSTYQNASLAAQDFPNVQVIDSGMVSTAQAMMVLKACDLKAEGQEADGIVAGLEAYKAKISAGCVIDTLDYMAKSGRLPGILALGANLLKIHPSVVLSGGVLSMGQKYRGSVLRYAEKYITDRLEAVKRIDLTRAFLTQTGGIADSLMDKLATLICSIAPFKEIIVNRTGCMAGVHAGPGAFGLLFATA